MTDSLTRLLAGLTMILTLKCDKASWLMSESMDRKLRIHERLALRGHLIACRVCPVLQKQLRIIQATGRRESINTSGLSEQARERFKDAVRHTP